MIEKIKSRTSSLQKEYFEKTRGVNLSFFDERCMNDPFNFSNDRLALKLDGDIVNLLWTKYGNHYSIKKMTVTFEKLKTLLNDYDMIIYTLPLSLLKPFNIKGDFNIRDLFIYKFKYPAIYKLWWDYLYVPTDEFIFHRVSRSGNELHFEVDEDWNFDDVALNCQRFIDEVLFAHTSYVGVVKIKGHLLNEDVDCNALPKKIMLLGRYAQWNSRIRVNDVIKRLYKEIIGITHDG
jgi:hypothetical protein